MFESQGEEFKQFLRRCTQIVEVREDDCVVRAYNAEEGKHTYMCTIPNPVKELKALQRFNKEKTQEHINDLLVFAKRDLESIKEIFQNSPQMVANIAESPDTDIDLSEFEDILTYDDDDK